MANQIRTNTTDYEQMAEAGAIDAQYRLGLLYSTGKGVPLDYVMAHKWLNLAAQQGNEEARRLRLELACEMTREEIAEAQRLARQWKQTTEVLPGGLPMPAERGLRRMVSSPAGASSPMPPQRPRGR